MVSFVFGWLDLVVFGLLIWYFGLDGWLVCVSICGLVAFGLDFGVLFVLLL